MIKSAEIKVKMWFTWPTEWPGDRKIPTAAGERFDYFQIREYARKAGSHFPKMSHELPVERILLSAK